MRCEEIVFTRAGLAKKVCLPFFFVFSLTSFVNGRVRSGYRVRHAFIAGKSDTETSIGYK